MANREGGNTRFFNGVVFNNYKYSINSRQNNVIYYVCSHYQSGTCRARGVLKNNVFNLITGHSHGPNVRKVMEEALKRDLYRHVTRSTTHYRKIYDSVRPDHLDASVSGTFSRLENSMYKWRQANNPPIVRTLRSYVETLNRNEWQHLLNYNDGTMSISHVVAADSSESVIIMDPSFVRKIAVNGFFFLDATFKVTPSLIGAQQFMTIMAKKHNKSFPIIWVLMSRKTTEAYRSVFRKLKDMIPEFQIHEAMTDYEVALQSALREEFPGIIVHGCHFHYCQALYRSAVRYGLKNHLRNNANIRHVISLLMSLALLPANLVVPTYNQICASLTAQTRGILRRFLNYYARQWLRKVTPQTFSVHMLVHRTNNYLEGYHTTLKERLGIHSATWNFTRDLIKFQESLQTDLKALEQGFSITRLPRVVNVQKQRLLLNAWSILHDNGFTPMQFLEHVLSYRLNIAEAYFILYSAN
ncbi:uncharacterized protein LOC127282712 [Leptopilina boulardi]|uniref:uncharacterized protein LOC127282712 n=1 Tax=Leptopilina boulardi TaxID=63433 RepID=UPI0021F63A6E|nr:uncharacterized protein LOC127282712 [Leptopilina boulardi]